MRYFILAVGLVLAFAACGNGANNQQVRGVVAMSEPPTADLSTPDRAIKSYWATLDAVNQAEFEISSEVRPHFDEVAAPLMRLFSVEVRDAIDMSIRPPDTFSRDINSVDVETESRAVIVATIRNTTPIPHNAEVSRREEELRRDGERYKYVLERDGEDWLIAEIWEYQSYRNDWSKQVPSDPSPRVPAYTYGGR